MLGLAPLRARLQVGVQLISHSVRLQNLTKADDSLELSPSPKQEVSRWQQSKKSKSKWRKTAIC